MDEREQRDGLARLRKLRQEALREGLERVNVHPRDETEKSRKERVAAFHRSLGLPDEVPFHELEDAE